MSYIYVTDDLLKADNSASTTGKKLSQVGQGVRDSAESNYQGTLTYAIDNNIYRAFVDGDNKVQTQLIFQISKSEIGSAKIVDTLVTDYWALFKFDNDTFYSYIRPASGQATATKAKSGALTFTTTPESLYYKLAP